jgi:acyl carrier protein phosphodiesterase
MNHLAHLVLAGPDEGLRLGALLGDHVKGRKALEAMPPAWAEGVRLHRRIDRLCDQHPGVRSLTASWGGAWRRYGPIVLDVLFDTMLTRHWSRFGPEPLDQFARQVDRMLLEHSARLPERLIRFARWARAHGLWQRYDDPEMLGRIFAGIERRHGRRSPISEGMSRLEGWSDEIELVFLELFPAIRDQIESAPPE